MDDFEKFLSGGQAVAEPPKKSSGQISSDAQAKREQTALDTIKEELRKNQELAAKGDANAKVNVAALLKEISRFKPAAQTSAAQSTAPAAPPPAAPVTSGDSLEAFLSGKPAPAPSQAPQAESTTGTQEGTMGAYVPRREPVGRVRQIVGNVLKQGFDARQQLGERTAGAIDTLYEALPATYGAVQQAIVRPFTTPEKAEELGKQAGQFIAPSQPLGKVLGITGKETYKQPLGGVTQPIAEQINKMYNVLGMTPEQISEKTGIPAPDIRNMVVIGSVALPQAIKEVSPVVGKVTQSIAQTAENIKSKLPEVTIVREPTIGGQSVGAAATPNATMVQQAMSVATPELQQALKNIPVDKINVPTFQRHIEADTLPIPVRLTEGQATGDVIKLSQEQNRRGKDPQLAERFNQQNKDLIDNVQEIRNQAAPDVYGTKTIENSQGIIDAYKELDTARNTKISEAYKKLEDENGGQFPVDGQAIAAKADALLAKKLKTEFLPPSIKSQLERFKNGEQMTFEQYEALRTNLAAEIRKAEKSSDGNAKTALGLVRQAAEELPLQKGVAGNLKGLADNARSLAKERFDMLKKDPAYNAAVNDIVPADNFIQKFVINGVNKNVQTMVNHLGKDSPARQHMAAGTINWLADKAGIYGEQANFSQAGFNKGLKQLDAVKNTQEIFDSASATHLRTLGNVAGYTQFQPRGSFVNNSNTLVGSLAEKGKQAIATGVEKGGNLLVPGLQLGTTVMEMRARRAAEAQTRKALELGAGTKQTGKNQINNLNNP